MDWLLELDKELLFFINGLHTPTLDEIMWILSKPLTSIPLYLFFIYIFWKKNKAKFWIPLLGALLVVLLADRISVECFKNVFCRLRPSHTEGVMETLHYYLRANGSEYRGGMYGFVSSHAANVFGVAVFMLLFARKHYITAIVLVWATLVSLSRVYLGVHFPTDILAGGALGALIGLLVYYLYIRIGKKYGWVN